MRKGSHRAMRGARSPGALVVAGAVAVSAIAIVACGDLFHDTSEIRNACELDASAAGCPAPNEGGPGGGDGATDAGPDASEEAGGPEPFDFCQWTSDTARQVAERACVWLGACMPPIGGNAFGECVLQARLAYDCDITPRMRLREGPAKEYWNCLRKASSCDDVERCVFPSGAQLCAQGARRYTTCGTGGNASVRVQCEANAAGAKTVGEACVGSGRTCARSADQSSASCTGAKGADCSADGCEGTVLTLCRADGANGTVDRGRDCASIGAGRCAPAGAPRCVPDGTATCSNAAPSCAAGIARACIANVEDTADCIALFGPGACVVPQPGTEVLAASDLCAAPPGAPSCTAGCSGSRLIACPRGMPVEVDCRDFGFSRCANVETVEGTRHRCAL